MPSLRECAIKVAIQATKMFKDLREGKPPQEGKSEKGRKIHAILEGYRKTKGAHWKLSMVARCLSVVLDEEIQDPCSGVTTGYPPYSVIVPISAVNGHTYPIGKPIMVTKGNALTGYLMGGKVGNTLPCPVTQENQTRPATDEEIEEFFQSLNDNLLIGMFPGITEFKLFIDACGMGK